MRHRGLVHVVFAAAVSWLAGCQGPAASPDTPPAEEASSTGAHDHEHAHEHGPHNGELVELGGGEYHAELVHDHDAHQVTVYLLDAYAKAAAPVGSSAVTINLVMDGAPRQFELPAAADANDPAGKSSRFQLVDEALCDALDAAGAEARVSVLIEGQSFTGTASHDAHDHAGPGHNGHEPAAE